MNHSIGQSGFNFSDSVRSRPQSNPRINNGHSEDYYKYFDINEFDSSSQPINVIFINDINDELRLLSGKTTLIKSGTLMDLPIWIALFLAEKKLVKVILPDFLKEASSDAFTISQSEINLNKFSPNFYMTLNMLKFLINNDYSFKYKQIFFKRIKMLLSLSLGDPNDRDIQEKIKTLDNEEKEIVLESQISYNDFKKWH